MNALQRVQALTPAERATISAELASVRQVHPPVDHTDISVANNGRQATVTAAVTRRIVGTGLKDQTLVEVITLEKRPAGWIILSVRPS